MHSGFIFVRLTLRRFGLQNLLLSIVSAFDTVPRGRVCIFLKSPWARPWIISVTLRRFLLQQMYCLQTYTGFHQSWRRTFARFQEDIQWVHGGYQCLPICRLSPTLVTYHHEVASTRLRNGKVSIWGLTGELHPFTKSSKTGAAKQLTRLPAKWVVCFCWPPPVLTSNFDGGLRSHSMSVFLSAV